MAQSDTIVQSSEQAPIESAPDTMSKQKEQVQPIQSKKRSIRKLKPTTYGFIPVKQEDGTIVYINEQTNDIAYEE